MPVTYIYGIWHNDVIKWKHFPRCWPFVWGLHRSPVNFPHKGQWRGALMFSLICAWINGWVKNREAGDLRCHRTHYDVIVMGLGITAPTWVLSATIIMLANDLGIGMILKGYPAINFGYACAIHMTLLAPPDDETGIFQENYFKTTSADALVPFVASSSMDKVFTMRDKRLHAFHKKLFPVWRHLGVKKW